MEALKTALVFLYVVAFMPAIHSKICGPYEFKCIESEKCLPAEKLCNGDYDCEDRTDERYCNVRPIIGVYRRITEDYDRKENVCPTGWWWCGRGDKCIPLEWRMNGKKECNEGRDEKYLYGDRDDLLTSWFLKKFRESVITSPIPDALRAVVALHLIDTKFFTSAKGYDIAKNLKPQILSALTSKESLEGNELALTIHALLVTCSDPWDFFGFNLVSKLRAYVEENMYQPFDLLALCNAGDDMTPQDAQKAVDAFYSKDRAFTTENQAMALMALVCIQSRTNFATNITAMVNELRQHQFENETFGQVRTTAIVLQALTVTRDYVERNWIYGAKYRILEGKKSDGSYGSLWNSYFIAPLLKEYTSVLNISNAHCQATTRKNNSRALSEPDRKRGSRMVAHYSVMMKDQKHKTSTLYVPDSGSLYDVIEIMNVLDPSQQVQYNVADGKPYVSSVYDVEDDVERGLYWYILEEPVMMVYPTSTFREPRFIDKSPVDIEIKPDRGYILWYRKRE